jgi:GNAT superfamily N-acetyltransferase
VIGHRYRNDVDITRLANATDSDQITHLQITNWKLSHPEIAHLLDAEDVQSQWAHAITDQGARGRVLICERDGILVGVAAVEFDQDIGHLSLIEVAPDLRRTLIGSRLLNAAADLAHKSGCMRLNCWLNEDQHDGRLFLESTGWGISGASRTLGTVTDDPDRTVVAHQIELTTSLETE